MSKVKRPVGRPRKIKNEKTVQNNQPFGVGGGQMGFWPFNGVPGSEQLSQVNSLIPNLRWYLITQNRALLSQLFAEIGLVQTICCVPVQDAIAGGIEIKSQEISEKELIQLKENMDRDEDLITAGLTAVWNNLYGGAGTLIITDQDPEEPLDIDAIGPDTPLEFRATDLWELSAFNMDLQNYDPSFQELNYEYFYYYGNKVHHSRVLTMKGIVAPALIRGQLRGWGMSVVDRLIRSINQYLRSNNLIYEVLDEFKLDIFRIKNLVNTLFDPSAFEKVFNIIQKLNYTKNYQNAMVLDQEDEYVQKQLSFSGIGEAMEQVRMQVSSDMRIPMLKLFGTPAKGLNATDENTLKVYNQMVESEIRTKMKFNLLKMCEIKCQKLFGFVPSDLSISFAPLSILSAKEEEEIKKMKFERVQMALMLKIMSPKQAVDCCNKDKLFAITLDNPDELTLGGADESGQVDTESKPKKGEKDTKIEKKENSISLEEALVQGRIDSKDYWEIEAQCLATGVSLKDLKLNFEDKIQNPGDVDEELWSKAKEQVKKEYGEIKWPVVTEVYKKMGGHFHKKEENLDV